MFSHVELPYEYTLKSLPGVSVSQNMVTGYSKEDVSVTDYVLSKNATTAENFFVYSTGLVIYVKATANQSVIKSNRKFIAGNDGNLHLVDD